MFLNLITKMGNFHCFEENIGNTTLNVNVENLVFLHKWVFPSKKQTFDVKLDIGLVVC